MFGLLDGFEFSTLTQIEAGVSDGLGLAPVYPRVWRNSHTP